MTALCTTYLNLSKEGIDYRMDNQKDILLPISHGYQTVDIEVSIDGAGRFVDACIIEKKDRYTIIPCTTESAARSGVNVALNPLVDRLSYLASDYCDLYGIVGEEKNKLHKSHKIYMDNLHAWNASEFKCAKICSIETYLLRGTLCKDLLKKGILKQDMLGIIANFQSSYIRFSVFEGDDEPRVYRNKECYESWIRYYDSIQKEGGKLLSYISGEFDYPSGKSPRRIRNPADNAKIISSNDKRGFTYLGVFKSSEDAASIGYKDMQYMHNALRYLIYKQGVSLGMTSIVAWEITGKPIPMPFDDITKDMPIEFVSTETEYQTYLNIFKKKCMKDLSEKAEIMIIALNSFATQGRISISFYDSVSASEYIDHIIQWKNECSWYRYDKNSPTNRCIFSPSIYEILKTAYRKDEIKKENRSVSDAISRLLPCVIQNKKIPYDIMNEIIGKYLKSCHGSECDVASLPVICAIIKKYRKDHRGEKIYMSLERNKVDRSYLYGRLLAVAQRTEEVALWKSGKKRTTTAENFQYAFSLNPSKVWKSIYQKLSPYLSILKMNGITKYQREFEEIYSIMTPEMLEDKSPLNELFIIGYYCELNELSNRYNNQSQIEDEGEQINE